MSETKLTPEIQAELVECIEAGMYYQLAWDAVGIGKTTFYEWLKKGKLENAQPIYKNFREAIKKAKSSCAKKALHLINQHSLKEWTAAAWLLERRYRQFYGKDAKELRQVIHLAKLLSKGEEVNADLIDLEAKETTEK